MIKIGIIDEYKQKPFGKLLKSLAANTSLEVYEDARRALDLLLVVKVPDEGISYIPSSPKIVIANSDDKQVLHFISSIKSQIITYGLNPKAAVTVSSHIDDGRYVVCVQRAMISIFGVPILPQEFSVDINSFFTCTIRCPRRNRFKISCSELSG